MYYNCCYVIRLICRKLSDEVDWGPKVRACLVAWADLETVSTYSRILCTLQV